MENVKNELLSFLDDIGQTNFVKCALIEHHYDYRNIKKYVLKQAYLKEDLAIFLESLNFKYDSGYGTQYIFGYVWFNDGTWLQRFEYDGSEWWEHMVCPEIPNDCIK